jgi:hypothetical protein
MAMVSAAAAHTTRLRIGTMVLSNDYRHLALVAPKPRRLTGCLKAGSNSASAPASRRYDQMGISSTRRAPESPGWRKPRR